ncbi:hypothetical protein GCM10027347_17330 [Larkinella harenae]
MLATVQCRSKAEIEPSQQTLCGIKDPINNIQWLNDQFKLFIGGPAINGILVYEYEAKTVIEVQNGLSSSTNQHQYYCDGQKLDLDDPLAFNKYKKERKELSILYGVNLWK